MVSRRYAAAFLVFITAFLATLFSQPYTTAALGAFADSLCQPFYAECGCDQIPNPDKKSSKKCIPGGKKSNTNKCGLGICWDDPAGVGEVKGICVAKNKCQAEQITDEGGNTEKPQTCGQAGTCAGTKPTEGGADEFEEAPKPNQTPQPNQSGGGGAPQMPQIPPPSGDGSPQPNQPQIPEPTQDPLGTPLPNVPQEPTPTTNNFGDFLKSGQAPSWLTGATNPVTSPFGSESQGIGNYFGADSLGQGLTPGTDGAFGNTGSQSLFDQAFNPVQFQSDSPGFTTPNDGSTATGGSSSWADSFRNTISTAYDSVVQTVQSAYSTAADALQSGYEYVAQQTGFTDPVPTETPIADSTAPKDLTDPFPFQDPAPADATPSGAADNPNLRNPQSGADDMYDPNTLTPANPTNPSDSPTTPPAAPKAEPFNTYGLPTQDPLVKLTEEARATYGFEFYK
jgi:hypothetical protein